MKIVKASNGKTRITLSKKEWKEIGRTAGWMKVSMESKESVGNKSIMQEAYERYQREAASIGHIETPISFEEFDKLARAGFPRITIHEIANDMFSNSFSSIDEAMDYYKNNL